MNQAERDELRLDLGSIPCLFNAYIKGYDADEECKLNPYGKTEPKGITPGTLATLIDIL